MNNYYPVLDHGFVCLKNSMGDDKTVEEAARCSYGPGTRQISDTNKLIRYLMRHGHTSPFEQVSFTFHIGLPIFVMRQLVRHRTAKLNEISGRYSILPLLFYSPEKVRSQSSTNKQGSDGCVTQEVADQWQEKSDDVRSTFKDYYEYGITNNVAREIARGDMPLSTYTYIYWTMDLRNLFHFLKLRLDSHAQWEIQQYSRVIAGLIKDKVPLCWQAFLDYELNAVKFSAEEMNILEEYHSQIFCDDYDELSFGLSKRETKEFLDKFKQKQFNDSDFRLPSPREYSYYEELANANAIEVSV